MITEQTLAKIKALESDYPDRRSLVMGALWAVQRESGGHVTREDLEALAAILEISPVEVQAAASFYTMYNLVHPVGRYHIQVCQSIACGLLGSEALIAHLEDRLGIRPGETTADGRFSLTTVECLGSCGTAPMMQVNDEYYENLDLEKVDAMLAGMK